MDEATVRDAVATLTAADGTRLLTAADVADVVVEGDWVAVVLTRENPSTALLARVHEGLTAALPGATVELRAAGRVYRGGADFGAGRHVVAVVGGKGGVGKSTISANLALTLAAMGVRVGLLDGDLNAPDIPHMLGVYPERPQRGQGWSTFTSGVTPPSKRTRPYRRYDLELMSVGFIVPERLPPALTGRVWISALLRYLVFETAWSADVLLIDAPPGTGEEIRVMAGELALSGALFVTTPQDLAQMDAERTLTFLNDHGIPVIGLVQNMASLTCPHCDRPIDMFAESTRLTGAGLPVLGRIPFDVRLSVTADQGRPLVLGDLRGPIAYEFARIGATVRRWLAERDGSRQSAGL